MASEGASSVTSAKRFARKPFQKSSVFCCSKNLPRCKGFSVTVETSPDVKGFLLQYGHFGAECDNGPELDRCYRCRSTAHIAR